MSRVLKLGLAGCGSVSQRGLLPNLVQEDTKQWAVLHAVMDPVPGRAEATADKFGAPLWFEDYDEMLASAIDAVVIASPIGVHYEQAMKAIAAGKRAALQIDRFLRGEELRQPSPLRRPETYLPPKKSLGDEESPLPRAEPPRAPVESRVRGFAEVEGSLGVEQATLEAQRCLRCDLEFSQTQDGPSN